MALTIYYAVSVIIGSAERVLLHERPLLWKSDVAVATNSSNQVSAPQNALLKSASLKASCFSSTSCVIPNLPICVRRVCTACSTDRQCKSKRWAVPYCNADGTCGRMCTLDAQCSATKKSKPYCSAGICVKSVFRSPDSSLATVISNKNNMCINNIYFE